VRRAFDAGADAVVVGTAISDIDAQVRRFAQAAVQRRA
jgi:putative N-acetylmannosamine-6-phosphate epimerase